MTYASERGLLDMDTTDVDRWIGVPLGGQQLKEPFSTNDIRRFVQGMQNPNPLYFDEEYAAQSRFGRIVAPQSYFGGGPGTGATPAIQGTVPGSHMLFGGDEFWWFGPRIYPGDKPYMERMLFDYKIANTATQCRDVFLALTAFSNTKPAMVVRDPSHGKVIGAQPGIHVYQRQFTFPRTAADMRSMTASYP